MEKITMIFGLDFGTSNSALSVNDGRAVRMVDIDKLNPTGVSLKSVIYFDEYRKQFFTGQKAVNNYVEDDASGRYMQSLKAFLSHKEFDKTEINYKLKIDKTIMRDEFEQDVILEERKRLSTCIDKVTKEAGISESRIDTIFLTGGSSYIPGIKSIFENTFGPERINHTDAFTSVAYGLGLYGSMFR